MKSDTPNVDATATAAFWTSGSMAISSELDEEDEFLSFLFFLSFFTFLSLFFSDFLVFPMDKQAKTRLLTS